MGGGVSFVLASPTTRRTRATSQPSAGLHMEEAMSAPTVTLYDLLTGPDARKADRIGERDLRGTKREIELVVPTHPEENGSRREVELRIYHRDGNYCATLTRYTLSHDGGFASKAYWPFSGDVIWLRKEPSGRFSAKNLRDFYARVIAALPDLLSAKVPADWHTGQVEM